jgi:UDP-N-acetylmuramoyl-tripeptide--D-alanyl-D-alanine ligase
MNAILSMYSLRYPYYLVYMLQQVEYDPRKLSDWYKRQIKSNIPFQKVMYRKKLQLTTRALALCFFAYGIAVFVYLTALLFGANMILSLISAVAVTPYIVYFALWVAAYVAHRIVILPERNRLIREAQAIFSDHKATKIAVLGSYGKTTMKELLAHVLQEGRQVAFTPGNMNVSVSHARFARTLSGNEEVIIVEFGEGEPGDIARMAHMLQPTYAIITGLAPNHLDKYDSVEAVAHDLLKIYDFVPANKVFSSEDSELLAQYLQPSMLKFSRQGFDNWLPESVQVNVDTLHFTIKTPHGSLDIASQLIGEHQVAPILLVAKLAFDLGLSLEQIQQGIQKFRPYQHRMQPRLLNGAWIIDDTYNGSIEGMRAGLSYLKSIKAKRKWYVTPGLVDQGSENEAVHTELGKLIADSQADIVILMENSARLIIEASLKASGFKGTLRIEQHPLQFYTSLEHQIAAGDVVLMQNDWTDNYA